VIGLDTNVLVRYLVKDDPAHFERARRLLQEECTADTPGVINSIVLCELFWVLSRAYRYPRERIAAVLAMLLAAEEIVVEHATTAAQALAFYRASNVDFADALIGLRSRDLGCTATMTFDKAATELTAFQAL
jgi:predicted nucleic-acid-binding protein